jgi:hypothetical protein
MLFSPLFSPFQSLAQSVFSALGVGLSTAAAAWILTAGVWNDAEFWDDAAFWID